MATRWTAELKKIERQFDGLVPKPSPAALQLQRQSERRDRERRLELLRSAGTWCWMVLVAMLGVSIVVWWPYPHACGTGFLGRLGAEALVVIGAVLGLATTWRRRMPVAHVVGVALLLSGLGMLSAAVLSRTGMSPPPTVWLTPWWQCP